MQSTTNSNLDVYKEMDKALDEMISRKDHINSHTILISATRDYAKYLNSDNVPSRTHRVILQHLPSYKTHRICSVCLREDEFQLNSIRQCKICMEYVHERCYIGIIDSYFICQRCNEYVCNKTNFKDNMKLTQCRYCLQSTGITVNIADNHWTHLHCLVWLFGVKPDEFAVNTHITKMKIPLILLYNRCNICNERVDLVKCVLKCGVRSCYFFMHVNCARVSRCIFHYDMMTNLIPR